jgi:16S rRNA (adenine1518-N6/adenine1519-N6)-dimethyltransferase
MFKRRYSQNFLKDANIAKKIIKVADLEKTDTVLEIGFGHGILTKIIQPRIKELFAIDIDKHLFTQLKLYCKEYNINNINIINVDFLQYNLQFQRVSNKPFKIISNLPYNIATKIIQQIMPIKNWVTAVLMIQKEVAQRIVAQPNNKSYGYISLFISYYAYSEILFDVSSTCFTPQPKVNSSVIILRNKKNNCLADTHVKLLFDVIKHCFKTRRKTILNCLSSFNNIGKLNALTILNLCNINILLRPNELSLLDFIQVTKIIKTKQNN